MTKFSALVRLRAKKKRISGFHCFTVGKNIGGSYRVTLVVGFAFFGSKIWEGGRD